MAALARPGRELQLKILATDLTDLRLLVLDQIERPSKRFSDRMLNSTLEDTGIGPIYGHIFGCVIVSWTVYDCCDSDGDHSLRAGVRD